MDPMQPGSFRLLDLAQEIQDRIYEKYFEAAEPAFSAGVPAVAISNSAGKDCNFVPLKINYIDPQPKVCGVPSLAIELVSKKVCADARAARDRVVTTTIEIVESFLNGKTMESLFIAIAESNEFAWLRGRTTKALIKEEFALSRPKCWSTILDAFPNLHQAVVEMEFLDDSDVSSSQELVKAFKGGELDESIAGAVVDGPGLIELSTLLKQNCTSEYSVTCVADLCFVVTPDGVNSKGVFVSMVSSLLICSRKSPDRNPRRGNTGSLRTLLSIQIWQISTSRKSTHKIRPVGSGRHVRGRGSRRAIHNG